MTNANYPSTTTPVVGGERLSTRHFMRALEFLQHREREPQTSPPEKRKHIHFMEIGHALSRQEVLQQLRLSASALSALRALLFVFDEEWLSTNTDTLVLVSMGEIAEQCGFSVSTAKRAKSELVGTELLVQGADDPKRRGLYVGPSDRLRSLDPKWEPKTVGSHGANRNGGRVTQTRPQGKSCHTDTTYARKPGGGGHPHGLSYSGSPIGLYSKEQISCQEKDGEDEMQHPKPTIEKKSKERKPRARCATGFMRVIDKAMKEINPEYRYYTDKEAPFRKAVQAYMAAGGSEYAIPDMMKAAAEHATETPRTLKYFTAVVKDATRSLVEDVVARSRVQARKEVEEASYAKASDELDDFSDLLEDE